MSLFFPFEYRADGQVLIITTGEGLDPYTSVRSSERVGENIQQILTTDDFFQKVMRSAEPFDRSVFENLSDKKLREAWGESVKSSVRYGTGILDISVYHPEPSEAKRFAGAVMITLADNILEYVGGEVQVKIVNNPIVTSYPVRPNLIMNMFLGAVMGFLFMFFAFLYRTK